MGVSQEKGKGRAGLEAWSSHPFAPEGAKRRRVGLPLSGLAHRAGRRVGAEVLPRERYAVAFIARRGRRIVNVVPFSVESTPIQPPWAVTIAWTI